MARTVIAAGGHDHPIASSAIQRINPQARINSMGTANAIYGETRDLHPDLAGSNLDASVPALGGPGISLIGITEFSATLLESFGGESAVRNYLALPHLPEAGTGGGEASRLRTVLEDLALQARHYLLAMDKAGVPPGPIFATGGWSRSVALMELRASVFGAAVTVIDEPELAGLGAALLAQEAATGHPGVFTSQERSARNRSRRPGMKYFGTAPDRRCPTAPPRLFTTAVFSLRYPACPLPSSTPSAAALKPLTMPRPCWASTRR